MSLCLALIAVALLAHPAAAFTLYGTSTDQPGSIFTIDTNTGAATKVTDVAIQGRVFRHGMAFLNGTAYLSDVLVSSQQAAGFGTLDVNTGAFTPLQGSGTSLNSLGMAPNVEQQFIYVFNDEDVPLLMTLKPDGTTGFIGPTQGVYGDIAFDNVNKVLYGVDFIGVQQNLVTINTQTAAQTVIGPIGVSGIGLDFGMEFDETTGTLYLNGGSTSSLYRINTATGAATLIGANFPGGTGAVIDAIAFNRAAVPIPVPPALWGGAFTMVGIVIAGRVGKRFTAK